MPKPKEEVGIKVFCSKEHVVIKGFDRFDDFLLSQREQTIKEIEEMIEDLKEEATDIHSGLMHPETAVYTLDNLLTQLNKLKK